MIVFCADCEIEHDLDSENPLCEDCYGNGTQKMCVCCENFFPLTDDYDEDAYSANDKICKDCHNDGAGPCLICKKMIHPDNCVTLCTGCGFMICDNDCQYDIRMLEESPYCADCFPEENIKECHICEDQFHADSNSLTSCNLCHKDFCDYCPNRAFSELCAKCDREASDDEEETIEIKRGPLVTEAESCSCWICKKKVFCFEGNDPRELSKREIQQFMKRQMGEEIFRQHYLHDSWDSTFKQYCEQNDICIFTRFEGYQGGSYKTVKQYYNMQRSFDMPLPPIGSKSKTMINACKCGPCHLLCLYRLRRLSRKTPKVDDRHYNYFGPRQNKWMFRRQCPTCFTVWQPELYDLFEDNEDFNDQMTEEDKHKARENLALLHAENSSAAHQWLKFSRQDEKLKGSYALVPKGNFGMRLRGKMLPWFIPAKINKFLELPPPQPSVAHLLKENRQVSIIRKLFGKNAGQSIFSAALMINEHWPRMLKEDYNPYPYWDKSYNISGFAKAVKSGKYKQLLYKDQVELLASFEKGNQGESKSST